jgi:hypothetical protein
VDARLARAFHVGLVVVEEYHLLRCDPQALAGQGVDRRVWLAQPALMRVDDLLDEVLEAVGCLFPLPRTDEAVAQDPRAVPGPQPPGVLDQLRVGAAEVLAPDPAHELVDLPLVEAEALRECPVHVGLADRADATAVPHVFQTLVDLARLQAEARFPPLGHREARGDLQDAADVEHNRLNRHVTHPADYPWGKVNCQRPPAERLSMRVALTMAERLGHGFSAPTGSSPRPSPAPGSSPPEPLAPAADGSPAPPGRPPGHRPPLASSYSCVHYRQQPARLATGKMPGPPRRRPRHDPCRPRLRVGEPQQLHRGLHQHHRHHPRPPPDRSPAPPPPLILGVVPRQWALPQPGQRAALPR